jgi:predicted MFS family arabinose efflux permease
MTLSWRGVNRLFVVSTVLRLAAEGHLIAFGPLQLRELGQSDEEIAVWSGLLFATTTAMSVPLGPFLGVLAERYSRKTIILRSNVFLVLALLVAAWAPDVWWIVLSRILVGLAFGVGGVVTATQAALTPRRELARAFATIQAAQPIAHSLGPPLGSLGIASFGLRNLYLLDAVVVLLAALGLLLLLPEPPGDRKPVSVLGRTWEVLVMAWRIEPVRWNFGTSFMMRGALSVVETYLPVRIIQVAADPASAIGLILGVYGACTVVATYLVGRIADRLDAVAVYTRAMLFGALLALGLALAPWLWLIGLLAVLRAIPFALSNILLFTHLEKVVPDQQRTAIFGLSPTPRNVGSLVFILVATSVASLAPAAPLAVAAGTFVLTSLSGLKLQRVTAAHARPPEPARLDPPTARDPTDGGET